jgi:cellulose synthase/poly-beta-1,6-N-acetylglucosamine synthase-like glycosyltransferase
MKKLPVSIGVITHNEAGILKLLLASLGKQNTRHCRIGEIIVVASGCTDNTQPVVRLAKKKNRRISLIYQEKREGKASAINLFLKKAKHEICILESGDTIPMKDTVEKLALPFFDPKVGMTGAHPVPVNPVRNFTSFVTNFNWRLTHGLCLYKPRLGEMVAFRKVFEKIPVDTAVDEACIEALVRQKDLRIVYVPEAIVRNKAPETIQDYFRQSRRIYAGHLHLEKTMGYKVASKNLGLVIQVLIEHLKFDRYLPWALGAVLVEATGRFLGLYDFYIKKKNPFVWEIAKSTKQMANHDQDPSKNITL